MKRYRFIHTFVDKKGNEKKEEITTFSSLDDTLSQSLYGSMLGYGQGYCDAYIECKKTTLFHDATYSFLMWWTYQQRETWAFVDEDGNMVERINN